MGDTLALQSFEGIAAVNAFLNSHIRNIKNVGTNDKIVTFFAKYDTLNLCEQTTFKAK